MSDGAKEVRILGENETAVQLLRDEVNLKLETLKPETKQRVRFFVGDVSDNAYMAEAMSGVDYVLYVPSLPRAFDCEVAPAECTITFLKTVTGMIHTAIDGGVKKLLVAGPAPENRESTIPTLLTALLETVVAEARYLGRDSDTTICFTRQDDSFLRIPCENFEMRR